MAICNRPLTYYYISVDNQRANFNTGPYGDPPALKIKILKIGFVHAREDQNIGTESKFHVPRSSNGLY